jgi:hypothetical protein
MALKLAEDPGIGVAALVPDTLKPFSSCELHADDAYVAQKVMQAQVRYRTTRGLLRPPGGHAARSRSVWKQKKDQAALAQELLSQEQLRAWGVCALQIRLLHVQSGRGGGVMGGRTKAG